MSEKHEKYTEGKQLKAIYGWIKGWLQSEVHNQPYYIKTTASLKNLQAMIEGQEFTNCNNEECLLRVRKIKDKGIIKITIDQIVSYN